MLEDKDNFIQPLTQPPLDSFLMAAKGVKNQLQIISPFITIYGVKALIQALPEKELDIKICSRFTSQNFSAKSLDYNALEAFNEWSNEWDVRFYNISSLHAKVFVFDTSCIVTSAYLTMGGLKKNYEFGIYIPVIGDIPDLSTEIDSVFSKAKMVSISEIKEIAGKSAFVLQKPFENELLDIEDSGAFKDNEEEVEESELAYTEEEIARLKRFDEYVEKIIDVDANKPPFGEIKTLEVIKKEKKEDKQEIGSPHQDSDEILKTLDSDLENINSYVNGLLNLYELPQEAFSDIFFCFVHTTFSHFYLKDRMDITIHKKVDNFTAVGKELINLYISHFLISGRYLLVEKIGFFEIATRQSREQINPNSILESLSCNWMLSIGNIEKEWRIVLLYRIVGIIFNWNPKQAWLLISSFIDEDYLLSAGHFENIDYKTVLIEILVDKKLPATKFEILERKGPDHDPIFKMQAYALGETVTAESSSKKDATKLASKHLYRKLLKKGKIDKEKIVVERNILKSNPSKIKDFKNRLADAKEVLKYDGDEKYLDCALTSTGERSVFKNRRSNEKLAYIGSILCGIYGGINKAEIVYKADLKDSDKKIAVKLSGEIIVRRFKEFYPNFHDFLEVHYQESTDRDVENICQSIIAINWLKGGWHAMHDIDQLFKNELITSELPLYELNQCIENGSLPKIKYTYENIGEGHQPQWSCHISIDDKLILKSKVHSIKNDAKVEAAEKVLLLFHEGKL